MHAHRPTHISTHIHYITTLHVDTVFRVYYIILSFNVYVGISILDVVFECCTLAAILIMCSMYVCMFLTRCHEFPFPATRDHLPRGATFAPNRRWPIVAGTTVVVF